MIPIERVKQIVNTYKTLEKELASAAIDKKEFVKKSKEYSNIGEIINEAKYLISNFLYLVQYFTNVLILTICINVCLKYYVGEFSTTLVRHSYNIF